MAQKILIYDIETTSTDVEKAEFRLFGFKTSEAEGFFYTSNISEVKRIIADHDVLVGYNIVNYDNKILEKYNISFRDKIIIDLMQILHGKGFGADKGRKNIIDVNGVNLSTILHRKTLDAASQAMGGPPKIGDFDYSLFKVPFYELSKEQQNTAIEYLKRDVEMTEHIYIYLEEYFKDFKDGGVEIDGMWKPFLTPEQVRKKQYLTASIAAFAYKAICNLAGLDEKYSDAQREDYGGGYVADPLSEYEIGNIFCLDFNSLYPHIMIQANLYGAANNWDSRKKWKGDGISKTIGIYYADKLSPVSKVLQQLYKKRLEYKKKKDERQYTIKILINTMYGLLGNPAFASVSNFTAASDCTRLGRQWIKYARKKLRDAGYKILYTDTDSVYLKDVFNDKDRMLRIKDEIINYIKKTVPFPQDTFDMGIDDEIDFIAFFKGPDGKLLKKNYLYVTTDGKLKIKGLQIIKSNATPLGKLIFNKYIRPEIIKNFKYKFKKSEIEEWIYNELKNDISLASVFFRVNAAHTYAVPTQIQAQIAQKFGEGAYNMIKLKTEHKNGVGVNKNYVRVEDLGNTYLSLIDVSKTMKELEPFIKDEQQNLTNFFIKKEE